MLPLEDGVGQRDLGRLGTAGRREAGHGEPAYGSAPIRQRGGGVHLIGHPWLLSPAPCAPLRTNTTIRR